MANKTIQPPYSLEAEQAVLGGLLIDSEVIPRYELTILPEEFYEKKHQTIAGLIVKLYNSDTPPDMITVIDLAEKENLMQEIGGRSYIADLMNATPTTANISFYLKIVKEKAMLRRIIKMGQDMANGALDPDADPEHLMDKAERVLLDASDNKLQAIKPLSYYLDDVVKGLSEFVDRPDETKGLSFSIPTLDKKTGGMNPGELIFLAARPGLGKTALALQIAGNLAINQNKNVLFLSIEMNHRELVNRMLAGLTNLPHQHIKEGRVTPEEMPAVMYANNKLYSAKMALDFSKYVSIIDIRTKVRSRSLKEKLDLVVIDYLQLIDYRAEKELEALTKITRILKLLAQEVECPILCLSQLNRKVEERDFPIPNMSDLRGSGSVEQDADFIFFLAPPVKIEKLKAEKYPTASGYYEKKTLEKDAFKQAGKVHLLMEKNRGGPSCDVMLKFNRDFQTFTEWI